MIRIAEQVSRAIRILRGNRDESARASHLVVRKNHLMTYESVFSGQAEMEKFSKSTFSERKIMSTKTSIKRIAAVAAVAAAFAGVSTVAANAVPLPTFSVNSGTASSAATATPTTGTYATVTLVTDSTETSKVLTITSTGVGQINVPALTTTGGATTGISATSATFFGAYNSTDVPGTISNTALATQTLNFSAYSATAGTQVITVTGGAAGTSTATITWGAAPTFSTGYSTAILNAASSGVETATADATIAVANSVPAGDVVVTLKNSSNASYTAGTVSATIAGSGLIAVDRAPGVTSPGSVRSASATAVAGTAYVHISGDSTSGTGTVTISVTDASGVTTVLATKTVTFTGSTAGVKSVANLKVLKAGGVAGTASGNVYNGVSTATDATTVSGTKGTTPLTAFTKDANGNAAYNSSDVVKAVSSNTAVVTTATCVQATAGADVATGEYNCPVLGAALAASGATATVTVTVYKADGITVVASDAPVTFTIGGSIASAVLSTDAASYSPLAPISVIYTAEDSSGNAAYDQDLAGFSTSLTSSILLGGALAAPASIKGGVATVTGAYAPASEYTGITISGTDGSSLALTTTFDVGSSAATQAANAATDAANEATDAANAATDAANAAGDSADAATQAAQDAGDKADAALAAVTALSQQVTSVLAKIAGLAASLARIIKKVKA